MSKIWNAEEFKKTIREAAAEGIVLLKNDNEALPLKKGSRVSIFGRSQMNYYRSGTGSGGMVNVDYVVGIYEALAGCGFTSIKRSELNMRDLCRKILLTAEPDGLPSRGIRRKCLLMKR